MTEFSRRSFVTSVVGAMGAVGVAAALPGSPAQAASGLAPAPRLAGLDSFLRVTGVTGDSTNARYRDWIVVESWSWGTLGVDAEPFTFTTRTGRHTATLMGKAFAVSPIDEVALAVSTVQGGATEVLTLTLKKAVVAQASCAGGDRTLETWTIPSFSRADLRMRPLVRNTPGPWESMTWPAS